MTLRRSIAALIMIAYLGFLPTSCKEKKVEVPPDSIWLVMINHTGQHLTKFELSYGVGKMEYEIFSRDYTFAKWVPIHGAQPMSVKYYNEAGVFKEIPRLERELLPIMIGGKISIEFQKEDQIRFTMDWP